MVPDKLFNSCRERLGSYVYILIDPRDNKIFYVGKGSGDRAFDHSKEAFIDKHEVNQEKDKIIKAIAESGAEVVIRIVRWGLTENEAYIVEAALIDLLHDMPGVAKLTNMVSGHHSEIYGYQTPEELCMKLSAGELDFYNAPYRLFAITLSGPIDRVNLYDQIKGNWNLNIRRAEKAEYVLAVHNQLIIGVFKPHSWKYEKPEAGKENLARKWVSFTGSEETNPEVTSLFLNKTMPQKAKGTSNPISYNYK